MHEWTPAGLSEAPYWGAGRAEMRAARPNDRVAALLSEELLPRVIARGRVAPPRARPAALARQLATGRFAEARAAIERRMRAGVAAEELIREDLAPAARALGELWRDDVCDFFDVTVALRELRAMLRDLETPASDLGPILWLAPAPEETHSFGAEVAARAFRAAGWRVSRREAGEARGAPPEVAAVGFSLSCERFADALAAAIRGLRGAADGRRVAVLVGGSAFAGRPEMGARLGADFCDGERDLAPAFAYRVLQAIRL